MLTNSICWLQATMKSLQILMNLKFKALKKKLLGVSIDTRLSLEHHITSLCKKASQKLRALIRLAHYMDLEKRRS